MTQDTHEKSGSIRTPSLLDALIPVGALLVLLGLSYYLFRDNGLLRPQPDCAVVLRPDRDGHRL